MRTIDLSKVQFADVSEMMRFPFSHAMDGIPDYVKGDYNNLGKGEEGGNQYKLLHYLSSEVFENELILDIGFRAGFSAMALALSRRNQIVGYDIASHIPNFANHLSLNLGYSNIMFKLLDINKEHDSMFKIAKLINLDVDPHDGIQERKFFDTLERVGFEGLVVLDDTHWTVHDNGMVNFVNSIKQPKYDVTKFAHGSGTHLVDFSYGRNFEIIGL